MTSLVSIDLSAPVRRRKGVSFGVARGFVLLTLHTRTRGRLGVASESTSLEVHVRARAWTPPSHVGLPLASPEKRAVAHQRKRSVGALHQRSVRCPSSEKKASAGRERPPLTHVACGALRRRSVGGFSRKAGMASAEKRGWLLQRSGGGFAGKSWGRVRRSYAGLEDHASAMKATTARGPPVPPPAPPPVPAGQLPSSCFTLRSSAAASRWCGFAERSSLKSLSASCRRLVRARSLPR